jgi:hypothetical protein
MNQATTDKGPMTEILKTHRIIQKAFKQRKSVYYHFLDTVNTPVSSAFYYQADRCIIFTCDGQTFKAFPSQLERFEIES